jgi:hypothetical protein
MFRTGWDICTVVFHRWQPRLFVFKTTLGAENFFALRAPSLCLFSIVLIAIGFDSPSLRSALRPSVLAFEFSPSDLI